MKNIYHIENQCYDSKFDRKHLLDLVLARDNRFKVSLRGATRVKYLSRCEKVKAARFVEKKY